VIGAWSDGAENSVITHVAAGASFEALEAAGAMMGSLAHQKAVLVFQTGAGDKSHFLGSFNAHGTVEEVHADLLQNGLPYHTLEPTASGVRVHIYGTDEDTLKATSEAGKRYGSQVDIQFGQGKFVGSDKDGSDDEVRADAEQRYQAAIRSYAVSESGGSNVEQGWRGLANRWKSIGKPAKNVGGKFVSAGGDRDAQIKIGEWAASANAKNRSLDDILKAAPGHQKELQDAGRQIAEGMPGVVEFKPAGIKTSGQSGIDRVKVKAQTRGLGGVTDVTRIGFTVTSPDQIGKVLDGLRRHFEVADEGIARNKWGYYDNKALVRYPDGMIGEVQIMEKSLAGAKSSKGAEAGSGHKLYDEGRHLPPTDPKRVDLMKRSQKVYADAVKAAGPEWQEIYDNAAVKD
jgi:hypothetical protein